MSYNNTNLLCHRICDSKDDIAIAVKRHRMSERTVNKFNSNLVIFIFSINSHNQVVTFLFCRIAGEAGVILNVFQRSAKLITFLVFSTMGNSYSGLEITDIFPQNLRFTIFRTNSEAN